MPNANVLLEPITIDGVETLAFQRTDNGKFWIRRGSVKIEPRSTLIYRTQTYCVERIESPSYCDVDELTVRYDEYLTRTPETP
jgi:hypothetical protein